MNTRENEPLLILIYEIITGNENKQVNELMNSSAKEQKGK
jgi:hypothetical protein